MLRAAAAGRIYGRRISHPASPFLTYIIWRHIARALLGSKALTILRPDAEDELAALDLFARFADQEVSFTNCTSFALMRRHRLSRAFTFDRHFLAAGFEVLPPR